MNFGVFGFLFPGLAPLVLRGACPQCSKTEMTQIKKTLAHIQKNFPAEWNKLIQTYTG
jgi:Insect pheromone-binding family, A10/OS-D